MVSLFLLDSEKAEVVTRQPEDSTEFDWHDIACCAQICDTFNCWCGGKNTRDRNIHNFRYDRTGEFLDYRCCCCSCCLQSGNEHGGEPEQQEYVEDIE